MAHRLRKRAHRFSAQLDVAVEALRKRRSLIIKIVGDGTESRAAVPPAGLHGEMLTHGGLIT